VDEFLRISSEGTGGSGGSLYIESSGNVQDAQVLLVLAGRDGLYLAPPLKVRCRRVFELIVACDRCQWREQRKENKRRTRFKMEEAGSQTFLVDIFARLSILRTQLGFQRPSQ
jgi:hypothetical protein